MKLATTTIALISTRQKRTIKIQWLRQRRHCRSIPTTRRRKSGNSVWSGSKLKRCRPRHQTPRRLKNHRRPRKNPEPRRRNGAALLNVAVLHGHFPAALLSRCFADYGYSGIGELLSSLCSGSLGGTVNFRFRRFTGCGARVMAVLWLVILVSVSLCVMI